MYNWYISRDLYFPKKTFSRFYFPGPHTAALILNLALMLPSILAPERLSFT